MAALYLALLHYPVYDKNGEVVTTSITNMDIHDISRSARTYGVSRFYVVTPVRALRELASRIIGHWMYGHGATYNSTRKEALEVVSLVSDLERAVADVERQEGTRPRTVVTSARPSAPTVDFAGLRSHLERGDAPLLLLLGTGWGLTEETIAAADDVLLPVRGASTYNHLSVRAAAAIMLDRLKGERCDSQCFPTLQGSMKSAEEGHEHHRND